MRFLFFLSFVFIYSQCVSGKTFTQCELARELKNQGIPLGKIPSWVCMASAESGRNTDSKTGPNTDDSYDWGIFHINDKLWCKPGSPGRWCNVKCEDLKTNDITEALKCAKNVQAKSGFGAWNGWRKNCRNTLPDLSKCY